VNAQSKRSILIVDDEKIYAELMAQSIGENLDCTVYAFSRPLEALAALARLDAGVIVTDYFMPQINGLEFTRRAAAIAPKAAFVLITGHNLDSVEDELNGLLPLKGRLQKPFGWRRLADEVLRVWPGPDAPCIRAEAAPA
jgi:CheY-like chemotaxis protein